MGLEIERKWIVKPDLTWEEICGVGKYIDITEIEQGYLTNTPLTTRVRISKSNLRTFGAEAYLTIKSPPLKDNPAACNEWEYVIPVNDARDMLAVDGVYSLKKVRHRVRVDELVFEIDEYQGALDGLWTLEVEFPSFDTCIKLPEWVVKEVTGQREWSNESLARNGIPK